MSEIILERADGTIIENDDGTIREGAVGDPCCCAIPSCTNNGTRCCQAISGNSVTIKAGVLSCNAGHNNYSTIIESDMTFLLTGSCGSGEINLGALATDVYYSDGGHVSGSTNWILSFFTVNMLQYYPNLTNYPGYIWIEFHMIGSLPEQSFRVWFDDCINLTSKTFRLYPSQEPPWTFTTGGIVYNRPRSYCKTGGLNGTCGTGPMNNDGSCLVSP